MVKKKKRPLKKTLPKKRKPAKIKPRSKVKPKPKLRAAAAPKIKDKIIGKVIHYFPHVNAAVVKLKIPLAIGDNIRIKGHTTDFKQTVTSMQIDRAPIESAKKGQEIGIQVESRARRRDIVYKA